MQGDAHRKLILNELDCKIVENDPRNYVLYTVVRASVVQHTESEMKDIVVLCWGHWLSIFWLVEAVIFDTFTHDVVIVDDWSSLLRVSFLLFKQLFSVLTTFVKKRGPVLSKLSGIMFEFFKPDPNEVRRLFKSMELEN